MKRIEKNSVTDVLMDAMENAESMEHVIVLYQTKKDCDSPIGFYTTADTEVAMANYLVDSFKAWMFTCHLKPRDDA